MQNLSGTRYINKKEIFICVAIIAGLNCGVLLYFHGVLTDRYSLDILDIVELPELASAGYILFTKGCGIPLLNPFDPTVKKYIEIVSGDVPCTGKRYLKMVNNSVFLDEAEVKKDYALENFTCTYEPILRNPMNLTEDADDIIEYGNEKRITYGQTLEDEFIKISCNYTSKLVHEEYLASTPIKLEVESRCVRNGQNKTKSEKLNVIVVGIDSVSKLHFLRHFRLTYDYLKNNLSVFEFHGYMKVADNTFPNLTPMLTGQFVEHYYTSKNRNRYFDDLDFIWKNYSAIGYRTFLAEDAPWIATYNYLKKGFQYPPTDYFLRPFTLAIEETKWRKSSKADCFQAVPEIQVLFDYLRSFLSTMKDRPYFAFTWAARLTHGELNRAGYADKPTFELLRDINNMGLLNKSLLIFVSDHGNRFGHIRKTYIGKIEDRMPFLFLALPKWFLRSFPTIENNLMINQKRLVTPFDLRETLVELFQIIAGEPTKNNSQQGISLFQEISPERTCKDAFILPHWCSCHRFFKKPVDDEGVVKSTRVLLRTINKWTEPHRNVCEELSLDMIVEALVRVPSDEMLTFSKLTKEGDENSIRREKSVNTTDYMVTVRTKPGKALFESTVRFEKGSHRVLDISRINEYGSQGNCISDFELRKYCYCKVAMRLTA